MGCAAALRAFIGFLERQRLPAPISSRAETDATSFDPKSELVTAVEEVPDVKPTQTPEVRLEQSPDEIGEARSASVLSPSLFPPPLPLLISEETFPAGVSRSEGGIAASESSKRPRSPSASTESLEMHDKIADLAKRPNGEEAAFVPEHSLRDLFKDPDEGLEGFLIDRLRASKTLDADACPTTTEIVRFICDEAPKIFATLVFSRLEHRIVRFFNNRLDDALLPVVNDNNKLISFPAEADVDLANMAVRLANEEASRIKPADANLRKKGEDAVANAERAKKDAKDAARKVEATFHGWDRREIREFHYEYQWRFMAPVFNETQFSYKFAEKSKMPFWQSSVPARNGPFSTVEKLQAHRNHLPKNAKLNERLFGGAGDQDHPWVAVKVLKRNSFETNQQFEEAVQLEANVLKAMRSLEDPHLIQTIAHYRRGQEDCFLFPWADFGNLRDYWEHSNLKDDQEKRLAPAYLSWVFTQLRGLVHAITLLHGRIIRHGDLKPENILCFRDNASKDPENPYTFVIADAGLAKINYQVTQLRSVATIGPKGGTLMYEPPEAEVGSNEPMSRRYDVWSMGCICLEFLVWLVDGERGLKHFCGNLKPEGKFYKPCWSKDQLRVTGAGRQTEVDACMKSLRERPCFQGKGNPLGCLIELIDKKLLVHNLGSPIRLSSDSLQVGTGKTSAPGGYKAITPSSRVDTATMPSVFELPPGSRAKSDTMLEEFDKILADKESFKLPAAAAVSEGSATGHSPPAASALRPHLYGLGQSLGVPGANGSAASANGSVIEGPPSSSLSNRSLRNLPYRLDDSWEYAADAEFPVDEVDWGTDLVPSKTASDLCPRCDSLELWTPACSFLDTMDGLANKTRTCALCHLLHRHMLDRVSRKDEIIYFFRVMSYITFGSKQGQPVLSIYTFPGAPSLAKHEIQTGLPKLPKAGSPTHIQILSEWISCCDTSHPCFPQDLNFVPTRLLDVGGTESESIRLVEKLPGDRIPRRYLALSHKWGSPKLHRAFCTFTHNITLFKQRIDVRNLPQTFYDAVQVTRSLGMRYLWIDSLCIIQDDPHDWDTESKLMEQVFSSAYVTISASCSSGTNDGFLKSRPKEECVTAQVPGDNAGLFYLSGAIDNFRLDVEEGDLSKRAWVLQERALSRRTIYFSQTQIYWECGQGVRCETLTKMKNQRASFLGDSNFPQSVDTFLKRTKIELYQYLYERFSNLEISFPWDRPVAIRGLETRLMRTLNTTGGFGIFDIYFHRCLLWRRSETPLKRIAVFNGPTVPSWSWMAYMGGIRYLEVPYGSVTWEKDVVSPYSAGVDGRGDREDIAEGEVPRIEAVARDFTSGLAILTTGDQQGPRRVILDEPDSDTMLPSNGMLKCVVIGRSKSMTVEEEQTCYVLIIGTGTMDDAYTRVWERIGVGVLTSADIALRGSGTRVLIQ